jgi:hypothetical protein
LIDLDERFECIAILVDGRDHLIGLHSTLRSSLRCKKRVHTSSFLPRRFSDPLAEDQKS